MRKERRSSVCLRMEGRKEPTPGFLWGVRGIWVAGVPLRALTGHGSMGIPAGLQALSLEPPA